MTKSVPWGAPRAPSSLGRFSSSRPYGMARLRIGISRYASVANAIEQRLALGGRLACQIGQGRLCITLRSAGATRWVPEVQLARALEMAAVARELLDRDTRASVRRHARHAVVVRF